MHYINGLWKESGIHRFASTNPATGETLWQGMAAGVTEINDSVAAAKLTFRDWSHATYEARFAICEQFKNLLTSAQEELALLIAKETGKALWDAKSEVAAVISKLIYSNDSYAERTGHKTRPSPVGNATLRHRPHGVMAVYGPYNFPAHLPNGHIMPALLAGNTVVFKPSEMTPMVGEWMVKKWEEAGLPPGVLNLVQGERDTGIALAQSAIQGILFTGSSATGIAIHKALAGRPEVLLALEMGGNNPLIVHEVSDIKAAVYETILSAFTGTGQRCTCARRLIIPDWSGAEEYLAQLIETTRTLSIGAYDDTPPPFMGPVISNKEADRLIAAQQNLINSGAKPLFLMKRMRNDLPFVTPGIMEVSHAKNIPDEEYFGPLLQVYRVNSGIEEAVALANHTRYGLSAALFSDNPATYQYVVEQLRAGLVNWNRQTTGASGAAPFGGAGISGNHRPAGYYSADYCSYPVASVENQKLILPQQLAPGVTLA